MLFSKFITLATVFVAASAGMLKNYERGVSIVEARLTGNCDSGSCLCSTNLVDSDGSVIGVEANCVAANAVTGECGSGCVLNSGPTACTNSLNQSGGYCATFVRCSNQHVADAVECTACLHGNTDTCPGVSCVAC